MVERRQRRLLAASAVVLAAIVLAFAVRTPMFRALGWALVANDPIVPADIIVVTSDSGGAGLLEAADLVRAGVSARVALFQDPPDALDAQFVKRGIPYFNAATVAAQHLQALGVKHVDQIPRSIAAGSDEGQFLPEWTARARFSAVVVVCLPEQARRIRRVLQRSMKGRGATVVVRSSHYSRFDPNHWWESRDGTRTTVVELQKLLVDIVRHPLS